MSTPDLKVPELTIPAAVFDAEGRTAPEIRGRILEHGRRYAGVPLDILIRQHDARKLRSEKANAYLWGVVYPAIVAGSESGNTEMDLHDAYCAMFLPTEAKQVEFYSRLTGESVSVSTTRRSSALKGDRFYDFVELIREHGRTFFGVETPDPDPEYWRKRGKKGADA